MEFVKVSNGGNFHSASYHRLLHSIVSPNTNFYLFIYLFLCHSLISKCFFFQLNFIALISLIFDWLCQIYSTSSAAFLVDLLASKYFKYIDVRYDY